MTLPFKRKFKGCKRCGGSLDVPSWVNCDRLECRQSRNKRKRTKCIDCHANIQVLHGRTKRCKKCQEIAIKKRQIKRRDKEKKKKATYEREKEKARLRYYKNKQTNK
jgi:hypothetical protein